MANGTGLIALLITGVVLFSGCVQTTPATEPINIEEEAISIAFSSNEMSEFLQDIGGAENLGEKHAELMDKDIIETSKSAKIPCPPNFRVHGLYDAISCCESLPSKDLWVIVFVSKDSPKAIMFVLEPETGQIICTLRE